MNPILPLGFATLALSACVGFSPGNTIYPVAEGYGVDFEGRGVVVTREGRGFDYSEGLEARRVADNFCRGQVNSSTRDNFRDGAWRFPQGCA